MILTTNLVIRTSVQQCCLTIRSWSFWRNQRCHCSTGKCKRCESFLIRHRCFWCSMVCASTKNGHCSWMDLEKKEFELEKSFFQTMEKHLFRIWCVTGILMNELYCCEIKHLQIIFVQIRSHQFGVQLWWYSVWRLEWKKSGRKLVEERLKIWNKM